MEEQICKLLADQNILLTEIRDELRKMTSSSTRMRQEIKNRSEDAQVMMNTVIDMLPPEIANKMKNRR